MMNMISNTPASVFGNFFNTRVSMSVDIIDNDDSYVIVADIPGRQKENINVEYKNEVLSIFANEEDNAKSSENYIRNERSLSFEMRSFAIPSIDFEKSKASYQNGVLTITLPKITKIDESYLIDIE